MDLRQFFINFNFEKHSHVATLIQVVREIPSPIGGFGIDSSGRFPNDWKTSKVTPDLFIKMVQRMI